MDGGLEPCPDCGALVPAVDGPTHRYIGGSAGCWAVFGELQVRKYPEPEPPLFELTTHIYCAQHPGVPSPQAIQSVAVHLIVLCLVIERGFDPRQATPMLQRLLARRPTYVWLARPASLGPVTLLDALAATTTGEHAAALDRWARSVWNAWHEHHPTLRSWTDAVWA